MVERFLRHFHMERTYTILFIGQCPPNYCRYLFIGEGLEGEDPASGE